MGEGEYNLNDLKEIMVTESYLGLDQEERGCQNEETLDNCTSRQYYDTILEKCGCLPLNMIPSEVLIETCPQTDKKVFYLIICHILGNYLLFYRGVELCE